MKIVLEKKAFKELDKIDKKIKEKIVLKIRKLEKFPNCENLDLKKLKTPFEWFRLRIWSFRVLFMQKEENIIIYAVNHRKEAYRK